MNRRRSNRQYRRVDRVNELLREIIAEELDRIDDEALGMVTITGVTCDDELTHATVYFSSLEPDDELVDQLARHRVRLQRAVSTEARLRRTPQLHFRVDEGVQSGARVEEILRQLDAERSDDAE